MQLQVTSFGSRYVLMMCTGGKSIKSYSYTHDTKSLHEVKTPSGFDMIKIFKNQLKHILYLLLQKNVLDSL